MIFSIPPGGKLPFSVPFSIAFNDDEFNPWTETSHFYSFYDLYDITSISPTEGKTTDITSVNVYASLDKPFSMPSATSIEEDILDYTNSNDGTVISKKSFAYQPITCRFGRFGVTEGEYANRTLIRCLTPSINDDSDVGYEEVPVEIALNGVDYLSNDDVMFTFIGPNAGKMIWVYILIVIFTAVLLIVIGALVSSYWNKIAMQLAESRAVYSGDQPHVVNKHPRYLIPELRSDLRSDLIPQNNQGGERNVAMNDQGRRNMAGGIV